jgi:hypothetical protein
VQDRPDYILQFPIAGSKYVKYQPDRAIQKGNFRAR